MALENSRAGQVGRCLQCRQKFRVPVDPPITPDSGLGLTKTITKLKSLGGEQSSRSNRHDTIPEVPIREPRPLFAGTPKPPPGDPKQEFADFEVIEDAGNEELEELEVIDDVDVEAVAVDDEDPEPAVPKKPLAEQNVDLRIATKPPTPRPKPAADGAPEDPEPSPPPEARARTGMLIAVIVGGVLLFAGALSLLVFYLIRE